MMRTYSEGQDPALIDDSLFTFARHDIQEAERGGYSDYSYWKSTWRVFIKNKVALMLLFLIATVTLFTIIQPYLPNQNHPTKIYLDPNTGMQLRNQQPNNIFWMGTNSIGQDLWARIWSGARTSLFIGVAVGIIETLIGIAYGSAWGYVRRLDRVLTELFNVWNNIPSTIVLILLTYIMRPSISTLIFAMSLTGWTQMARLIRNLVIIIRDREYNLASRCLGTPTARIITKNILPYLVSIIMMRIALAIPYAIGYEVFLTYIGLGLPLNIPSLGNLLNEGRLYMMSPTLRYQLYFPMAIISIITISFYVLGNTFADASDPKNHV